MTFKTWLEYGDMYPEEGNWVIIPQDQKAAAIGAITLPAGTYLVIKDDKQEIYTLKQKPSGKLYRVFYSDMDQMIRDKQAVKD